MIHENLCPICGKLVTKDQERFTLYRQYATMRKITGFRIHHACHMKSIWLADGDVNHIKVDDFMFNYLTITETSTYDTTTRSYDTEKYWKVGKYALKKRTQEEYDHYEGLHCKHQAKKELIKK